MAGEQVLGCIGLGVMGEPICANLIRNSGVPGDRLRSARRSPSRDWRQRVWRRRARSRRSARRRRSSSCRCRAARSSPRSARGCCRRCAPAACWSTSRPRRSISPASLPRGSRSAASAMPTRRSRAPGTPPSSGELSVMVGAEAATFARIEPLLRCFASDVLHCGGVGTGQVAKLMNNMVLFEIGQALAEALAIGRRSGIAPEMLLDGAEPGLGRQLRAAQPWPQGDAARRLPRARVLDPLRAEGPRLRAGAGRAGGRRRERRPAGARALRRRRSRRATATAIGR